MSHESDLYRTGEIVHAAKTKSRRGVDIQDILSYCQSEGLPIKPAEMKAKIEYMSGGLHRFAEPTDVVLVSFTDAGKTQFVVSTFAKEVSEALLGSYKTPSGEDVKILDSTEGAGVTKAIIRVAFGVEAGKGRAGFTIWDTPGTLSDNSEQTRITEALLDPDMETPPKLMPFVNARLSPARQEDISIEEMRERFPMDRVVVVFMIKLSLTPFEPFREQIRENIEWLKRIYGDRLLVFGSFKDKLDGWEQGARDLRREILQEVVGADVEIVEYSGTTKANLLETVKQILRAAGGDPKNLLRYIQTEFRGSRLEFSLRNMAQLIAAGISRRLDSSAPYSDWRLTLTILIAIHLFAHYSVSAEEWLDKSGDIDGIMSENHLHSQVMRERQRAKGWWQSFWAKLGKKYYKTIAVYTANDVAIAEMCALLYTHVHELEKVKTPIVDDEKATQWFIARFEENGVAEALEAGDAKALRRSLEDVLIRFWHVHHPEALDLATQVARKPDAAEDAGGIPA